MTTMTTEALPALPPVGSLVNIRPDTSPLRYWASSRSGLMVHSSYAGEFRPSVVTVIRHDAAGDPRNIRVSFTDPEGDTQETWMDVTEIAQPGLDYSAIDAATVEFLRTTELRRNAGTLAARGNLRRDLQDAIHATVRAMVDDYRGGTRWTSTREAGRAFWTNAVRIARTEGRGFASDYSAHDESCDQMGEWLRATILPLVDSLPTVPVQTLNEESWPAWEQAGPGMAVPAYTREGTLVMVDQVHSDGSVSAWQASGTPTAFGSSTMLRRVTKETRLEVTSDDDHLGRPVGATVYYVSTLSGRRDREQSIHVSDYPNTVDGDHMGYKYLRSVRVHAEQPVPVQVVDATVVVDGVEYVRKDVIDRDIKHMVETLHKGAVDNGLCPVYDKTQRAVDAGTQFIKMGSRYRTFDVTVEQTIVVSRTFRVDSAVTETAAQEQAASLANVNRLLTVTGRIDGETVRVVRRDFPNVTSTTPVN